MSICIFCKSTTAAFNTREHILPESLGGGDWAVLPPGFFCDGCQNIFGSQIERQALSDYPFSMLRVFLGIPTKKLKAPWLSSWEGKIAATPYPGIVGYEPAKYFAEAFHSGRKTVMRILAETENPRIVCRFLLKMAIELLATTEPSLVFSEAFDEARVFALTGEKQNEWWYMFDENITVAKKLMIPVDTHMQSPNESLTLELIELDKSRFVFHMKLFYLDMFCPLDYEIYHPPKKSLVEPEHRLYII